MSGQGAANFAYKIKVLVYELKKSRAEHVTLYSNILGPLSPGNEQEKTSDGSARTKLCRLGDLGLYPEGNGKPLTVLDKQ